MLPCSRPREILDGLKRRLRAARRLVLFLDYDGTLRPIARRPQDAMPGPALLALLRRLENASGVMPVIVTGRTVRGVRALLPLRHTWFVGTHGAEWGYGIGPVRRLVTDRAAEEAVSRIVRRIKPHLNPAVTLETKRISISLHYRMADPGLRREPCRWFEKLVKPCARRGVLTVLRSKGALEAKSKAAHKGRAVEWLFGTIPRDGTFCVALGDDRTDADLFRAARPAGVRIAVGDRLKAADYRLKNPTEVIRFLRMLERFWSRFRPIVTKK